VNPGSYFRKELLQARKDWLGLLMTVVAPFPVLWIFGELRLPTAAAAPPGFPTMDPPVFAVLLTIWLAASTAAATSIIKERAGGMLQRLSLTPFSGTFMVAAKAVLFVPVACLQAVVTLVSCHAFLGDAFAGRPWQIAIAFAALSLTAYGLGILFSAACGSITQVASATTIASMASIIWCGFFRPTSALGTFRSLAELLPLTVSYDAVRTASHSFGYAKLAILAGVLLVELALAAMAVRLRSKQVSHS